MSENAIASDEACAAAIAEVGAVDRKLAAIATEKSAAVAAATKAAEDKATPLLARRSALSAGVEAYATEHRGRLARSGKTVEFPTGTVNWRDAVDSIDIPPDVEKKIVGPLKQKILGALKKLIEFYAPLVSVSVKLSKTGIKSACQNDPALQAKLKRQGIAFVAGEETCTIVPAGAELADRPEAVE